MKKVRKADVATFHEKEWPASDRANILVVKGALLSENVCLHRDCTARLALTNRSGYCQRHRKYVQATDKARNVVVTKQAPEARSFAAEEHLPLATINACGPRIAKPPKYPVPDLVLKNGKNAYGRGFWAGVHIADNGAQTWHTCRKRPAMPPGYIVVLRVERDPAGTWFHTYTEEG